MPASHSNTPPDSDPLHGLSPDDLLAAGLATEPAVSRAEGTPPPSCDELAGEFPTLDLLELLGRGGMGAVYKARQRDLDRYVALKILRPGLDAEPGFSERFAREAKALAQLNHPGIVTLYEFGRTTSGRYFILMEFVDGVNLRQLLAAGRMAPREALAIVPPLCDALQYAHDRGILHRDIKPENILVDRLGRVKIADFGVARLAGATDDLLTSVGQVMGTPAYMAPEQGRSPGTVDHRADLYALGVVFYQMLTGELPKPGQLEPPSHRVQIDVRLDEIVLRAMEKNPERRYADATEFKTRVETVSHAGPQLPAPRPFIPPGGFSYRSKRTLFGLPWLHVATGVELATGRRRVARGIVAVGDQARGVFAFGGIAIGVFAFGGVSIGLFGYGGLVLGLFAFGGLGVALLGAFAGLALAPVAMGGCALGWYAYGGWAVGVHALSPDRNDPSAMAFFHPWVHQVSTHAGLVSLPFIAGGLAVMAAAHWFAKTRLRADFSDAMDGGPRDQSLWRRGVAWSLVPVVAVVLALYNPWGARAWYYFACACAILAIGPGFELLRRRDGSQTPFVNATLPRGFAAPLLSLLILAVMFCGNLRHAAQELPAMVASHFGADGLPDAWVPRSSHLLFMLLIGLGLPLLLAMVFWALRFLPASLFNLPKRDYWLAPEHRPVTDRELLRRGLWLAVILLGVFCAVQLMLQLANSQDVVRLPPVLMYNVTAFFLMLTAGWVFALWRYFKRTGHVAPAAAGARGVQVNPWVWLFVVVLSLLLLFDTGLEILRSDAHRQSPVVVHKESEQVAFLQNRLVQLRLEQVGLATRYTSRHPRMIEIAAQIKAADTLLSEQQAPENLNPLATMPKYSLGPVHEVVLPRGRPVAYDFDNDHPVEYVPTPESPRGIDKSPNWHLEHGTDIYADPDSPRAGVLFQGTAVAEVSESLWTADADTVVAIHVKRREGHSVFTMAPVNDEPPATRVYRTLQGGIVLVQILGANDARDVRMRYKRIVSVAQPIEVTLDDFSAESDSVVLNLDTGLATALGANFADQAPMSRFNLIYQHISDTDGLTGKAINERWFLASKSADFRLVPAPGDLGAGVVDDYDAAFKLIIESVRQSGAGDNYDGLIFQPWSLPQANDKGWLAFVLRPADGQDARAGILRGERQPDGRLKLEVRLLFPSDEARDQSVNTLSLDRAGDTMQNIVQRLRRDYGLRLAFENIDFTPADAVTLGQRLNDLTLKEIAGNLQGPETDQLRTLRRLRDEQKLSDETFVDVGERYTGVVSGESVSEFLAHLTDGTPYMARKIGETWIIEPRAGSVLDFPVTLKTAGLTVEAAMQAILAQSPSAHPIGSGMVFTGPVVPGIDPTPWMSVQAPALEFKAIVASEALSQLTEASRPASVWELAGYQDSRLMSLAPAPADETLAAVNAAQGWLRGIDDGHHAASWQTAAALFRQAITKQKWVDALGTVRAPLGEVESRRLITAKLETQLPGMPPGRYLVMRFSAAYNQLPAAIETLTFQQEPDGAWRAVGYFIRPAASATALSSSTSQ